jgi:hypothetical protein
MKDDRIHKQSGELPPSNLKRNWASFFAGEIHVPEDFLPNAMTRLRNRVGCHGGANRLGSALQHDGIVGLETGSDSKRSCASGQTLVASAIYRKGSLRQGCISVVPHAGRWAGT